MNLRLCGILDFLKTHLGIPTLIVDKDFENLKEFEKKYCQYPNIQKNFSKEFLSNFFNTTNKEKIYHIEDALKTNIVIINVLDEWCILGPYVESIWTDEQLEIFLSMFNIPKSHLFDYKIYRSKQIFLSTKRILIHAQSVVSTFNNSFISQPIEYIEYDVQFVKTDYNKKTIDIKIILKSYDIENKIIAALKSGDVEGTIKAWRTIPLHPSQKDVYTASRSTQFAYFFTLKTLVRKAAEEAGVDILIINSISQDYAQKFHTQTNIHGSSSLSENMLTDFAQAVKDKLSSRYSSTISETINFINFSLGDELQLSEIAKNAGISEAHLSRLFKKETDMTISHYIKIKRTEKASELIKNTDLPIQNISNFVGYPDGNYFVKVFKSIYGVTPSEYRKNSI